jgi:hypothetical protein
VRRKVSLRTERSKVWLESLRDDVVLLGDLVSTTVLTQQASAAHQFDQALFLERVFAVGRSPNE